MVAEGEELETNLLQASQRNPASLGVLDEVFDTHSWGLCPLWWKKTLKELPFTFNARAETVATKLGRGLVVQLWNGKRQPQAGLRF